MIDNLDKIYYKSIASGLSPAEKAIKIDEDLFFEVVDCLYTGRQSEDETVQELESARPMQVARNVCRMDAWRSVSMASEIVKALSKELKGDEQDEDRGSKLRNALTSNRSEAKLLQAMEDDGKSELILGKSAGAGGELNLTGASPEEIKFRKRLANAAEHDPNIRDILQWFGVFYNHANNLKRERFKRGTNITDVKLGNDITELVTTEFVGLGVDELETLFLLDFVEESLLQFEKTDEEEGKKGGITLGIDVSGSMLGPFRGSSIMNVAIGFAMAVVRVMEDEDRPVSGFVFNYSSEKLFDPELSIFEKIERLINISASGGTRIEAALVSAYSENPKSHDVLIITDGEDQNYNAGRLNEMKALQKSTCLLVSNQYNAQHKPYMAELFDTYIPTNSEEGFKDLMNEVLESA